MIAEVDIRELAARVRAKRGTRGLRLVAEEIGGVSASTLSRIEQGKVPDLDTFARICRWLGISPNHFLLGAKEVTEQDGGTTPQVEAASTPEIIAAHLKADRTLDPKTAEALATMVRLVYEASARGELGKRERE